MKKELIDCKTDEDGIVIAPELHDSCLSNVNLGDTSVVLSFSGTSGEKFEVHLSGVIDLVCENLRKGNVVLDLTLSTGKDADISLLDKLFIKPRGDLSKYSMFISSLTERIIAEKLVLVELNPSYGCQLVVICEDVKYLEY